MNVAEIIVGVLIGLLSLVIIVVILLQESRRSGISGAISGGADTFLSKNKARTVNATLARWTKVIAISFLVLVVVSNVLALTK